jgi:hypothetical protein
MENRSKLLSILVMGSARELAYIPWGVFGKPWSSLFYELSDSNFAWTTKAKAPMLTSQEKICDSGRNGENEQNGKLTKHASVSIPNLSSPPSHLGSPQPIWLWISQFVAVPMLANP